MTFKLLKPNRGKIGLSGLVISITKNHVALSKDFAEDWPKNCGLLYVFIDKEKGKIGIKPRKKPDINTIT